MSPLYPMPGRLVVDRERPVVPERPLMDAERDRPAAELICGGLHTTFGDDGDAAVPAESCSISSDGDDVAAAAEGDDIVDTGHSFY